MTLWRQMQDFDKYSETYQEELDRCLKISGESSTYFAEYKVRYLGRFLPPDYEGNILDYGCGIGLLAGALARFFPRAGLSGYDISAASIAKIDQDVAARGSFTSDISELGVDYDLIVLSNVMHHIPLAERWLTVRDLAGRLSPSGIMAIFEHNPRNPFTRRVVDRCPFDRGARLLAPSEAAGYLLKAGLDIARSDYIVFFPAFFKWLRPLERYLGRLPLGAQYVVAGEKNA